MASTEEDESEATFCFPIVELPPDEKAQVEELKGWFQGLESEPKLFCPLVELPPDEQAQVEELQVCLKDDDSLPFRKLLEDKFLAYLEKLDDILTDVLLRQTYTRHGKRQIISLC